MIKQVLAAAILAISTSSGLAQTRDDFMRRSYEKDVEEVRELNKELPMALGDNLLTHAQLANRVLILDLQIRDGSGEFLPNATREQMGAIWDGMAVYACRTMFTKAILEKGYVLTIRFYDKANKFARVLPPIRSVDCRQ